MVGTSLYVVQDKVTTSVADMRSFRGSAVDLTTSPTTGSAPISQNIDGSVGDSTSSSSNTGNNDSSSSSNSSSSSSRVDSSYSRLGSDVVASGSGSSREKKGSVRGAKVASFFSEEVFLFHRMSSYRYACSCFMPQSSALHHPFSSNNVF